MVVGSLLISLLMGSSTGRFASPVGTVKLGATGYAACRQVSMSGISFCAGVGER